MSKPLFNIGRLRAESGSDGIIPSGSFNQTEPLTSYTLNQSVMSVDMFPVTDWPSSAVGIVSTSKVSDLLGSQVFSPTGQTTSYQRRWDEEIVDMSDNFDVALNTSKWNIVKGAWVVQFGYLQCPTTTTSHDILESKFAFVGDFDIEVHFVDPGATNTHPGMVVTTLNNQGLLSIIPSTSPGYMGNRDNSHYTNQVVQGSYDITTGWYRLTRIGNLGSAYHKTSIEGAWVPIFENAVYTYDDVSVVLYAEYGGVFGSTLSFDNFIVNTGTPYMIAGGTASWKEWLVYKDPIVVEQDSQNYTDTSIIDHNVLTIAHGIDLTTVVTDITGKEDVGVAQSLVTTHETTYDHTAFITLTDLSATGDLTYNNTTGEFSFTESAGLTRSKTNYINDVGGTTEFTTPTSFTNIADVDVIVNGVTLVSGTEFTDSVTTPGTAITLITATTAGDDVVVLVWNIQ